MIGTRSTSVAGIMASIRVGLGADELSAMTVQNTQSVSITDSADPVGTGDAYSYTVQVTNTGGSTINSVSCVVTLDAALSYVSSSGTGWSITPSGSTVTCTRATMAPGAAPAITINVTAGGSAGTRTTTVAVTASNASSANGSQSTTVVAITKDGPSTAIMVPASLQEWTAAQSKLTGPPSVPQFWFRCQEAASPLVDDMQGMSLTANGTPAYQQSFTSWTGKVVTTADGNAGQGFSVGNVSALTGSGLWDPVSQSVVILCYFGATTPAVSGRTILSIAGTSYRVDILNNGRLRIAPGSVSGTISYGDSLIHPLLVEIQPNSTVLQHVGSGLVRFSTDKEQVTSTWSAPGSGNRGLAAAGTSQIAPTAQYRALAAWVGTAADAMITAGAKNVLQRYGWTVTGY